MMWGVARQDKRIRTEGDFSKDLAFRIDEDFSIDAQDSYTWFWNVPDGIEDGIYRVYATNVKPKISKKPPEKPPKVGPFPLIPLTTKLRVIGKRPTRS